MNRKKIDNRIRLLIENNVIQGYRSIFAVVGEKARDQVVILHHMLLKSQIKPKPSVLWCYKKELGFSTNRRKRMRMLKRKERAGNASLNEDDPFEMFISGTNIRWCYYHETDRILGNTYDMLVLQDFEALTPNLLARTVETVEGGGIIIILLNTLNSLQQLYSMAMDVHNRYRTEAHKDVVSRFNERFILSLASCPNFLPIDERLNILPISSHIANIEPIPKPDPTEPPPPKKRELMELKKSLADKQPLGSLVECCKTLDQAKAVIAFVESLSEKSLRTTISMTAARGRGKSAALGLAIAGAIAYNYCNIFVTSPSPENLKTLFEFIIKGLDAIHLKQHLDYEVIQSTKPEFNKAIVRINVLREFQQTIQYIPPSEVRKDSLLRKSAEVVVIDEAAAIPLPIVRSLLGPYLVFMSSTINGYEGTGRSLSLKLLRQLRDESTPAGSKDDPTARSLSEITLEESIRYKNGDHVEAWLNQLLCLEVNKEELQYKKNNPPDADDCQLFYINRDTLFSFHPASEAFLQKLMALYVSSHYKNSPNDLQMMSDAPAHHLFCLLGPGSEKARKGGNKNKLPEVLCFLQVCLEGEITKEHIMDSLSKGKRASGDLIPWTLSQQFQDTKFPSLSGARVVRIATNPNYQGKGYGTKALQLLCDYYLGKFMTDATPLESDITMGEEDESSTEKMDETELSPKKSLPPLLLSLEERKAERLDYMGVSYGITYDLYRFWKSNGFVPVYIRQTTNELTGENSCIMVKVLNPTREDNLVTVSNDWLVDFWTDFRRRFVALLAHAFKQFPTRLALEIVSSDFLQVSDTEKIKQALTKEELDLVFSQVDLDRCRLFGGTEDASPQSIRDVLPALSHFYFTQRLDPSLQLNKEKSAVLLGLGLQRKSIQEVSRELGFSNEVLMSNLRQSLKSLVDTLIKMKG